MGTLKFHLLKLSYQYFAASEVGIELYKWFYN